MFPLLKLLGTAVSIEIPTIIGLVTSYQKNYTSIYILIFYFPNFIILLYIYILLLVTLVTYIYKVTENIEIAIFKRVTTLPKKVVTKWEQW